jgi:hypothetical protein
MSWAELLGSLARKPPEVGPPPPIKADLWERTDDHNKRIVDLEQQVADLEAVVAALVTYVQEREA